MAPQNRKNEQVLTENFDSGVPYQPMEQKLHPKVGLLRSKIMPTYVLNNSQRTLEKVQKTTFLTPKIVKNDPQNRQNEQIFDRKFRCLGSLSTFEAANTSKSRLFLGRMQCLNTSQKT